MVVRDKSTISFDFFVNHSLIATCVKAKKYINIGRNGGNKCANTELLRPFLSREGSSTEI